MKKVISGGTSSEYMVSPTGENGLVQIGTRRLRLINVDIDNLVAVDPDGSLQLQWSYHLNQGLALCREHGWIPHIIIGHVVPPPLAIKAPDGRIYEPSSWNIYDQYVQDFLNYVVVSQGFVETEWEVGNEMNTPSLNWVAPVLPASPTDPAGFTAYSTLYSHIAAVVDEFRQQHPGLVLRVGGPAAEADWAMKFVDLIASNNVPADFVTLHVYGNQLTGAYLQAQVRNLEQELANRNLSLPVSITEWGPTTDSKLNFEPIAGAFALDFASTITTTGVSDAIFLALSQFPNDDWPVLYTTDQAPTDIMAAFEALAGIKGSQDTCTSSGGLSCVAVTGDDGTVSLLAWSFSWAGTYFPDVMAPARSTYTIAVQPGLAAGTVYAIQSAQLNSHDWDQTAYPIVLKSGGTDIGLTVQIPYGSYASLSLKPN